MSKRDLSRARVKAKAKQYNRQIKNDILSNIYVKKAEEARKTHSEIDRRMILEEAKYRRKVLISLATRLIGKGEASLDNVFDVIKEKYPDVYKKATIIEYDSSSSNEKKEYAIPLPNKEHIENYLKIIKKREDAYEEEKEPGEEEWLTLK